MLEIKDNKLFEFAKSTEYTTPDFIYFDDEDKEEEYNISDTPIGARLIISMILSASDKNISKLQALMCVFSGLTLREAGEVCNKSHEYVRLAVESIKGDYPELYAVMIEGRYRVDCLVPIVSTKWTIINIDSNRKVYCDTLLGWCRKKKIPYHIIRHRVDKHEGNWCDGKNNYQIKRNY